MRSHVYHVKLRDWVRALLPTLAALACLAGLLRAGEGLRLLPAAKVGLDSTSTVLAHQSYAARSQAPAQIVLVGDSTCMMGVDAPALSARLPGQPAAVNLALIISFGFGVYGDALADFAHANPGQVRAVVLLVTPSKLARSPSAREDDYWRQLHGREHSRTGSSWSAADWLGLRILRQNLLSHWLAAPLRGRGPGIAYFGFSSEVDAYMTAHHGSLLEFGQVAPPRRPEVWSLGAAPELAAQSREFRAQIPPEAKLFIGLTPIAQSYSTPAERRQRAELLAQWEAAIKPDGVLTNLPATLPNVCFASKGHLNEAGQRRFTALLARELAPRLNAISQ